jgi:hypothetical protein
MELKLVGGCRHDEISGMHERLLTKGDDLGGLGAGAQCSRALLPGAPLCRVRRPRQHIGDLTISGFCMVLQVPNYSRRGSTIILSKALRRLANDHWSWVFAKCFHTLDDEVSRPASRVLDGIAAENISLPAVAGVVCSCYVVIHTSCSLVGTSIWLSQVPTDQKLNKVFASIMVHDPLFWANLIMFSRLRLT